MHPGMVLRKSGLPELLQPVPFHELVVHLSFPTDRTIIENVFLALSERPLGALNHLFGFSPPRFQGPVAVELVALVGDPVALLHDRQKTFVPREKGRFLDHLDKLVIPAFD